MFNIFEDQIIEDVVSRAEQSRISYNLQAEEFRHLNTDLQLYLDDLKTIDDNNRQLQEKIENLRLSLVLDIENQLKRLPNDFRNQSLILTNGHIERYQFKSRARLFLNEREEFKRRIHFLSINEKQQTKLLNNLQKQERLLHNEFIILNEKLQTCLNTVEKEKQAHQQAMNIFDNLRIQLEDKCVERSKTEFEIQTLKEEVQLMQTTKEFLDEERETIAAAAMEANEHLLASLNASIDSIRTDFDQLNKAQLNKIENEYNNKLRIVEENLMSNQTINNTSTSASNTHIIQELQDEYQISLKELTLLSNDNLKLSECAIAMEADLYSLREEQLHKLKLKETEIEHDKIELQLFKEKLNHLDEYDRNLKFELALYRGVLESEHRRKQYGKSLSTNIVNLRKPTTLQSQNHVLTDITTTLTTSIHPSQYNDHEQINTYVSQQDRTGQNDQSLSIETSLNFETLSSEKNSFQQTTEPSNQKQDHNKIDVDISMQYCSNASNTTATNIQNEDRFVSSFDVPQTSSLTFSANSERSSSSNSCSSIVQDDQLILSSGPQLSTTSSDLHSLPISQNSQASFKACQIPTVYSHVLNIQSEPQQISLDTSSINARASYEFETFSTLATDSRIQEDWVTSEYTLQSHLVSDEEKKPISIVQEQESSSAYSSETQAISSDNQTLSSTIILTKEEDIDSVANLDEQALVLPKEHDLSSTTASDSQQSLPSSMDIQETSLSTSLTADKVPLNIETSVLSSATLITIERQEATFDIHEKAPILSEEYETSSLNTQKSSASFSSLSAIVEKQSTVDVHEPILTWSHQPSTFTETSTIISDMQRLTSSAPAINVESQESDSYPHSASLTTEKEHVTSLSVSTTATPLESDIQKSSSPSTTKVIDFGQLDVNLHEISMANFEEQQASSHTASIASETERLSLSSTIPITTNDVQSIIESLKSESDISSDSISIPSDIEKQAFSHDTQVTEHEGSTLVAHQVTSELSEENKASENDGPDNVPISTDINIISSIPPTQAKLEYESSFTTSDDSSESSEMIQQYSNLNVPTATVGIQDEIASKPADDYQVITLKTNEFHLESQNNRLSDLTPDKSELPASTQHMIDKETSDEIDQTKYPITSSSIKDNDISNDSQLTDEPELVTQVLISVQKDEKKLSPSQSCTITLHEEGKPFELKQDENLKQIQREELLSSHINQKQEDTTTFSIRATIVATHSVDDNLNESNSLLKQDITETSNISSSLINATEVDQSTSQKLETISEHEDYPSFAAIMEDLRGVFHELANDEDLIEITDNLSVQIMDRLEFRDSYIRNLFDNLIRKYIIEPAVQMNRRQILDWIEFRDILFPIITGHYTEGHVRKLFDLFDASKDSHLSIKEITELLDILQVSGVNNLAQIIMNTYDGDHDGRLTVDELIEAIRKTENINEHVLSEETESQQWFTLSPIHNRAIPFEVPIINLPHDTNNKFFKEISALAKIFKNVGADSDSNKLDCDKKNLSQELVNEFLRNNTKLPTNDLQSFIDLFLSYKHSTNSFINWIEFRDTFFPIVTNGYYSKSTIQYWFDLFDLNQNGSLTRNDTMQILHLLQIQYTESIINKLNDIRGAKLDDLRPWTLDELMFAMDNLDETTLHQLTYNEQIDSFDTDWFSNNSF